MPGSSIKYSTRFRFTRRHSLLLRALLISVTTSFLLDPFY